MLLGQTSSRGHSAFCPQAVVRLQFRQPPESPLASTPTESNVLGHQMLVLAVCLHPCIPESLYPCILLSLYPCIPTSLYVPPARPRASPPKPILGTMGKHEKSFM